MSVQRRLRTVTSLVVAPVTFLSMALLDGGPAQAVGTSPHVAAPPSSGVSRSAPRAPHHPGISGVRSDKRQRAAERHYTPTGCNEAQTSHFGRSLARCFSIVWTHRDHKVVANADQPPEGALGPADIQSAYNLPDAGNGQTVAVVDAFGYSSAEEDLAVFRSEYGLPPCTTANGCFTKVDQNGGTDYPPDDEGWALETALDLDAVSSACPNCNILLVEGDDNDSTNLGTAVNQAVSLGAKFVSNSYGIPGEDPDESTLDPFYDHPGVAVVASTGDIGNLTNYPATSPTVTAAAGTTLTADDSDPRGWHETAWADGGSGCSLYEAKPDYQESVDTQCDNRAIGDISADADPDTGLAVYDTLGNNGWLQVGGTSLSSPLLAAMYAVAGTPVPGTYPVSYPYDHPGGLNDVTEGSNGDCGNLLCEAGPGWDGPTGLGTPAGVSSLTTGPHGDLSGTVTAAASGDPIEGATVSTPDGYTDVTDASGDYDISLPVGTYRATATAYGFHATTKSGLVVTTGNTTTADFALASVPSRTVSGVVTDGSGHRWPLYAAITIDGYPNGTVYTNPYTGAYSVSLPQGTHHLHVAPVYPGYQTVDATVRVAGTDVERNVAPKVDPSTCTAAGYHYTYDGTAESFTGWTGTTPQDGWAIVDNEGNGQTWSFDNPGDRDPPPGSDGDLAGLDSDAYGEGEEQDSSLVTPSLDLSAQTAPEIGFDTDYKGWPEDQIGNVDFSVNGGASWRTIWHQDTDDVLGHVEIPIPAAAGKANIEVRFHFEGAWGEWWLLDNVFIGTRTCSPIVGGLVAGVVRDQNTNAPVNGALVSSDEHPAVFGVSAATPDDPGLPDGFYWLFSPQVGQLPFTASDGKYVAQSEQVGVTRGSVTHKNWLLAAGHLTVTPGSVETSVRLGQQATAQLTFGNHGTVPVHVELGEQNGSFTPMAGVRVTGSGPPVQHIAGRFTTHDLATSKRYAREPATQGRDLRGSQPYDPPWMDIPDLPIEISSNAAAASEDGVLYSVGGYDGNDDVASGYAYDPSSQAWNEIADLPETLEAPAGAFLDGSMYVVGGWDSDANASSAVYAYDPATDSWTHKADLPTAVSAASAAVLDGQLYVVGGCTTAACAPTSQAVFSYDPGSDSWTQLADLPAALAFVACAGISGEVVCAGGVDADSNNSSKATYIYDPGSDSWTEGADMPIDIWGAVYAGANDSLQTAGGITDNGDTVTNQAFNYDPGSDEWTALPNANNAVFRGAGACGFYQVGGSTEDESSTAFAEVLPGYDSCGKGDVSWLSEDPSAFDVSPGDTVTVTVTTDSSAVTQPGDYLARLGLATDSPYSYPRVDVTMHVAPPAAWGKIRGTVTDVDSGDPVPGATVQICTMFDRPSGTCGPVSYSLKTDDDGYYQLWLNHGFNPLEIIAAKDGFQPQVKITTVRAGATTTTNFSLKEN